MVSLLGRVRRARRVALALALALIGSLAARDAGAQAVLRAGFGGPAGFGTDALVPADDDNSVEVSLATIFPSGLLFNGERYSSVFVNVNGNVSFGSALGDFSPRAFPGAMQPMIAAWWADVDTRGTPTPGPDGIFWHRTASELIVTWHNVGYFNQHRDKLNSFQLVLTRVGTAGDFDIELRYNRCEWTTGDETGGDAGLGGSPAIAGYEAPPLSAAGTSVYSMLPGSGTAAVLDLCRGSNIDAPGEWVLHVRSGSVALCGNGVVEPGEECDQMSSVPPGLSCTDSCTLCGTAADPCPVEDAGGPDVLDASDEADTHVADAHEAGEGDALSEPAPDAPFDDAGSVEAGFDATVDEPIAADVHVEPDVSDASAVLDASGSVDARPSDAGLDAAASTDSAPSVDAATLDAARVVERYEGAGLLRCSVRRAPGAAQAGGRWSLALVLGAVVLRRRRCARASRRSLAR